MKIVRESESVVLVVGLKKPSEDTDTGRENIQEELLDFIGEQCNVKKRSLPQLMLSLV